MKLAIPTLPPGGLDSSINPHFGKCETVTFVTLENQKIQSTNIVTPQGQHSCAALPALFAQNKADVCLVGGIGGRPYMILQEYGIKTYRVDQDLITKPVKDVVEFFISNQLSELENASCQDHNH
ncbi:MAG: NifB/NifX family molybdenum-iron cluster-binding protein [Candidatus Hodarchaeales archaeon]